MRKEIEGIISEYKKELESYYSEEILDSFYYEDVGVRKVSLDEFIEKLEKVLSNNPKDYKSMSKIFIGETIKNFFCNGFFGGDTYDLEGAKITRVYESSEGAVVEVAKENGRYEYALFDDDWKDWKTVYEHLSEWTNEKQEE